MKEGGAKIKMSRRSCGWGTIQREHRNSAEWMAQGRASSRAVRMAELVE